MCSKIHNHSYQNISVNEFGFDALCYYFKAIVVADGVNHLNYFLKYI